MITKRRICFVSGVLFNGGKLKGNLEDCLFKYVYFFIAGMAITVYLGFANTSFTNSVISQGIVATFVTQLFMIGLSSILVSTAVSLLRPIVHSMKVYCSLYWKTLPD